MGTADSGHANGTGTIEGVPYGTVVGGTGGIALGTGVPIDGGRATELCTAGLLSAVPRIGLPSDGVATCGSGACAARALLARSRRVAYHPPDGGSVWTWAAT